MTKFVSAVLASALAFSPTAAGAADLTIWWAKGYYPSEDEGLRRVVAGFEDETRTRVDLTFVSMPDLATKTLAALEAGRPPDVDFLISEQMRRWAFDGALLNLDAVIEPIAADLDPMVRELATMENGRAGGRGYYRMPIGLATVHIHVWQSLMDQAGIPISAIPGGVGRVLGLLVRRGPAGGASAARAREGIRGRPDAVDLVPGRRPQSDSDVPAGA